jgi:hypothetical protein
MEAKQIFGLYCSEEQVISLTDRVHSINNFAAHSTSREVQLIRVKKATYLFSIRTPYVLK